MSQAREDHERAGPTAETTGGAPTPDTPPAPDTVTFDVFAEAVKSDVQDEVAALQNAEHGLVLRGYIPCGDRLGQVEMHIQPLGGATTPPVGARAKIHAAVDAFALQEIFPEIITQQQAALFGCAWGVFTEAPKPLGEMTEGERRAFAGGEVLPEWPPVAQWRSREEVRVMLAGQSRHQAWQAPIIRPHGQLPTIGYWTTLGHDEPWQLPAFQNLLRALRGEDLDAGASS